MVASGFGEVEVRFRTPVPEGDRLQQVTPNATVPGELRPLIDAFNLNMERLNDRLFTHLEYAVVGVLG
ncbi:MAG: hypothetical protein HYU53_00595 [Acidobacteria bacterium]|nr:hypothetical protein [Acidobacteriota bacterium]